MFGLKPFFMDAAGEGGGTGPADSPPAAAAPTAAPTPAAPPAAPATALQTRTADPDPHAWLPEKHRVIKDDGSLDIEASARKNAEAYGALEKRLGSSDVPPASAGEYQITAPDELKDAFQPEDPGFKEFLTAAHAAGMTQKQMDAAMGAFFNWAPKLIGASQEIDHDACVAKLQEVWPDAAENRAGWKNAMRALGAYGGERAKALSAQYGNNPDIVWLLAQVGKEMAEDVSPQSSGPVADDIQALMSSEAYHNPKHADHKRVSEKVSAHFAQKFGTK